MRNIILFIIALIFFSCNRTNSIFTNGQWILESVIYLNTEKTDSMVTKRRIQFLENGNIMENKYNIWAKYKIDGNKFHFISGDTISATYNILKSTEEEILIESTFTFKYNDKDTTVVQRFDFHKTNPISNKAYDDILYNLAKMYNLGEIDTLGNGSKFINFNAEKFIDNEFVYDNPFQVEPKIKGAVDKTLGMLPKKEEIDKLSTLGSKRYNYYEWETLDFIMKMENSFETSYKDKPYLKVRIWIVEK